MKNKLSFLLFLACSLSIINASGQATLKPPRKGESRIVASLYNGVVINSLNVKQSGKYPDPIHLPNNLSFSQKISLEYERTTKRNLIWGFGLELGSASQNFDIIYKSFDFVDTTQAFKDASSSTSFRNKSKYFSARLTIGYSFPLHIFQSNDYKLDAKFTLGKSFVFDGGEVSKRIFADWQTKDTLFIDNYLISQVFGHWGNQGIKLYGQWFTEFNVGLRKKIDKSILGDVYLGVYAYCNTSMYYPISEENFNIIVTNRYYLGGQPKSFDRDYYAMKDFTVGLKLGIGLKL